MKSCKVTVRTIRWSLCSFLSFVFSSQRRQSVESRLFVVADCCVQPKPRWRLPFNLFIPAIFFQNKHKHVPTGRTRMSRGIIDSTAVLSTDIHILIYLSHFLLFVPNVCLLHFGNTHTFDTMMTHTIIVWTFIDIIHSSDPYLDPDP